MPVSGPNCPGSDLPMGAPFPITGGAAQQFQGGRITWKAADGTSTVTYE
jgi:uncharacterized protein with LGFP repeats